MGRSRNATNAAPFVRQAKKLFKSPRQIRANVGVRSMKEHAAICIYTYII